MEEKELWIRDLNQCKANMWLFFNFSFGTKSLNNFYIILFLNHCLFRSLGVIGFKNRFYTPVSKFLCIFFHIGKPLSIWLPPRTHRETVFRQWYKSQCSTSIWFCLVASTQFSGPLFHCWQDCRGKCWYGGLIISHHV